MHTNENTTEAIKKLVEILTEKGVKIRFSLYDDNAYYPILNEIVINSRQNVISRYYSFLHEVGHYLMRQQSDFSSKYLMDHSLGSKNKTTRIDVLREEVVAWDKAMQFAEENSLLFDKKKWDHYSKKFIYQYALWTVNPQRFEND